MPMPIHSCFLDPVNFIPRIPLALFMMFNERNSGQYLPAEFDIPGNGLPERDNIREFPIATDPFHKINPQIPVVKVAVKIENINFNSEFSPFESGIVTDVTGAVKILTATFYFNGIDSLLRQEFIICFNICSRKAEQSATMQ